MLTVWFIFPVPFVVPLAPPENIADQLVIDVPAGALSIIVAPTTLLGPLLVAVTVYVVPTPGIYVGVPSVLVILKSACGFGVSVSVALLLPGVGSVVPTGTAILAVFTRLPVTPDGMFNMMV